ncbi:ABC transporter ATP-binding protein [Insolitispirillum peregrinum]|uniref:ATP-binding cassette, subfamily B n=1 Tax=Insolitispirillum peregrinum TaxID=80876 RepID=A0A1N7P9H9_9PROT|nr:ABC transporter ATP-binding protein [Insolitispirillum peregrinum]SIT07208.1 ATP-binding cassette, subfamily B [Insolitispirillum peregrinum]
MTEQRKSSPLAVYLSALRPWRGLVYLMLGLACLAAVLELAPWLVAWRMMVAVLEPAEGDPSLQALVALALGLVLARFAVQAGVTISGHRAAFQAEAALRHRLIDHLARLPLATLEGRTGDLKQVVMEDVGRLNGLLAHTVPDVLSGLLLPLVTLAAFAVIDWRMALASAALLPIGLWAQARMAAGAATVYQQWVAAEARSGKALLSYVRGIATLRAFSRQASSLDEVRQSVQAVQSMAEDITRRSAVPYAVFGMCMTYPLVVLLPLGLLWVNADSLAFADYLLFLALGGVLLLPLNRVMMALHGLRKLSASGTRIMAVLEQAPQASTPVGEAVPADASVRFEAVDYAPSADPASPRLLHEVSFALPAGTVTVVTGPSGAGKTTLARLLTRMIEPTAGRITLGGIDLRDLPLETLRAQVAIVFQDPVLFHASLRDNIRLARPAADDTEVIAALRAAGAGGMLVSLPDGLDTLIGDRGTRLSGGERQRIALARAFLKNAPVLILDEATAHVDPVAERDIRQAMTALMQGRSVLLIAHRLRGAEQAGQVVVMDGGRVVASGPHQTLLADCDLYRRLWQAQDSAADWSLGQAPLSVLPATQAVAP